MVRLTSLLALSALCGGAHAERWELSTPLSAIGEADRVLISNYIVGCVEFPRIEGAADFRQGKKSPSQCRQYESDLPGGKVEMLKTAVRGAVEAEGRKTVSKEWFYNNDKTYVVGRSNTDEEDQRPMLLADVRRHGKHSGSSGGGGGGGGSHSSTRSSTHSSTHSSTRSSTHSSGRTSKISFAETQGALVPGDEPSAMLEVESQEEGQHSRRALRSDVSDSVPRMSRAASKWPSATIPYCWGDGNWNLESFIYMAVGMRLLEVKTDVQFAPVRCSDGGHKVKLNFVSGAANSWVGVVNENSPGSAVYFGSALATTDLANSRSASTKTSTYQSINYDAVRGDHMTCVHEWIHTIGGQHTHMRSDSTNFVTVSSRTDTANCAISSNPVVGLYHYNSVMHYPASIGGSPHQCGFITAKTLPWYRRWYAGDPTKMGEPRNGWEERDTTYVNAILA